MSSLSNTQIDKLGERLKTGEITDQDLRLLDEYRLSFSKAHEFVVGNVQERLGLAPTGRPAKSTSAIIEKLKRESIRLTQIQDIAGCRLVVSDINSQESVVSELEHVFDNPRIVDRRKKPSYGYRAVHIIVVHQGKSVEIQVRTALQHLWAELSERLSDQVDHALKYGQGDASWLKALVDHSSSIASLEDLEDSLGSALKDPQWEVLTATVNFQRTQIVDRLKELMSTLPGKD